MRFWNGWRTVALGLTGVGLTFALSGMSFAQSPGSVAKQSVTSAAVALTLKTQRRQSALLANQHGTIVLTPLGHDQWQAVWTWPGLGYYHGPAPDDVLWGWEGTQPAGVVFANLHPGPDETVGTHAGDTVTIDFTAPPSYPAHPEVVQFSTWLDIVGAGPMSPVGQLPEVPWAAGLPLIALAPIGVWAGRRLGARA